jgi:tetratricopeptide (TPR) repeat protein
MRWLFVALWMGAFLAPAQAQTSDAERAASARMHYETGMAHFNLEEWDQAIAEWEVGYRTKPVPEFIYNIAQAYRKSQRYEKALTFYQRYLRLKPDAENRKEVEKQIDQLPKLIEEQKRNPPPPTAAPVKPETPSAVPSEAPRPAPATSEPSVAPAPARADLVAHPAEKPVYKKGWFWGVTVGAVVVVAAGVTLGVIYGTRDNTPILPAAVY